MTREEAEKKEAKRKAEEGKVRYHETIVQIPAGAWAKIKELQATGKIQIQSTAVVVSLLVGWGLEAFEKSLKETDKRAEEAKGNVPMEVDTKGK